MPDAQFRPMGSATAAAPGRRPRVRRWVHDNSGTGRTILSFLFVTGLWEAVAWSGVAPLIVAKLENVALAAIRLLELGELQEHVSTSLVEFAGGFVLAAIVGVALGLLIATSAVLSDFVEPWIAALYATPIIALAPLFIIVFGIGPSSKIAIVFLLAFFPIVINTASGVRTTDAVHIEVARSYSATRRQIFSKVLLPSAVPFILTGLRLGVGRGLIGVVAGELFGARAGLGFLILTSSQVFDIPGIWLGVFILAGTGILSNALLQRLERRLAPWREFTLE